MVVMDAIDVGGRTDKSTKSLNSHVFGAFSAIGPGSPFCAANKTRSIYLHYGWCH